MSSRDWITLVPQMVEDARQSPRYAVEAAVDLLFEEIVAQGRTHDVSRGGFCAIVDKSIGRGQVIRASLSLVFDEETFSEPLELPARVVWSTTLGEVQHQIGLQFLALDQEQKEFLDMFLRYLEEGHAVRDQDEEEDEEDTEDPFAS